MSSEQPQACGGCADSGVPLIFLAGSGWEGLPPGTGLCRRCVKEDSRTAEVEQRSRAIGLGGHWAFDDTDVHFVSDSDFLTAAEKKSS